MQINLNPARGIAEPVQAQGERDQGQELPAGAVGMGR
jgi:hypothetical protein